ncbi:MAG: amidohydrolase [Alphaproteobacteria bacterium]|nr:MAG: amidohydrolase [Alphaproteobacteria bacterium]
MTQPDLVLRGGTVLTPAAALAVDVAVRDGRIHALGPGLPRGGVEIDCTGRLVTPGMLNLHCHAAMVPLRGLGEDVPDRLSRVIWPLEQALVDAAFVRLGAAFGLGEQLLSGVTTTVDLYFFEDQVAEVADRLGIRLIAGHTIADQPMPDAATSDAALAAIPISVARWRGHPLIQPALAPHGPHTVADATLRAIADLSERYDLPVLTHLAETLGETTAIHRRAGVSPVRYLDQVGLLTPRLIAAHGIHLDAGDIDLIARRGAVIAHCVGANTKAAKGTAPLPGLLAAGCKVGLGTDGPMSGNTLDIQGQLAQVAKVHKLITRDRSLLPSRTLLDIATQAAADAIGRPDLGRIAPGAAADLVVWGLDHPSLQPNHDPYATLVYAASPRDVREVIVAGRRVVIDGRLASQDLDELRQPLLSLAQRCRDTAMGLA